jgi:vanillate O-demethylase monooxygenase subunit
MQAHKFKQDDITITESIYQSLCTAFEEDRRMIEAQQRMLHLPEQSPMQMIIADKGLAMFRRMLAQLHAQENTQSSAV